MARIPEITDTTFGEVVFKSSSPVLVEFWAEWAKACALAEPHLAAAVRELGDGVRLVRCNVEASPMAATVYAVHNLPRVILFRRGQELDQWSGSLAAEEVAQRIRAASGAGPAGQAPAPGTGAGP